jgi:hypothetical protein
MVGIISNERASEAQANLQRVNDQLSASISRLGGHIRLPEDMQGGLPVGPVLQSNVNALKTAYTNAAQARLLLGVPEENLNIDEILQYAAEALFVDPETSDPLSDNEHALLDKMADALNPVMGKIVEIECDT